MLKVLLLLVVTYVPMPTWMPSVKLDPKMVGDFMEGMRALPDDLRPDTTAKPGPDQTQAEVAKQAQLDLNCAWASFLMGQTAGVKGTTPYAQQARQIHADAKDYYDTNCGSGPGLGERIGKEMRIALFLGKRAGGKLPSAREHAPDAPPFPLPPMPDRAGQDFGAQLWTMFQGLELRLAKGGHKLTGDGRSCAWASAALAGAEAVQKTKAATPGIGAAVPALDAQRVATCRGEALAQKEAAWRWLRANPGATQPLEVARSAPAPAFPASPEDPLLWAGAALLFSVAPEAAPVLLLAR